jgi:hypothetical protein
VAAIVDDANREKVAAKYFGIDWLLLLRQVLPFAASLPRWCHFHIVHQE